MAPSQIWGHRHMKVLFSSSPHFLTLGLTPEVPPCFTQLSVILGSTTSHSPPLSPRPWFLLLHLS